MQGRWLGLLLAISGCAFLLAGCQQNTYSRLVTSAAPPVWRLEIRHGTISGAEAPFLQERYRVRSADAVVWEVERESHLPECSIVEPAPPAKQFPVTLAYGETPRCYRSTVSAAPLIEGAGYVFESDDPRYNSSLHKLIVHFRIRNGRVEEISEGQYRRLSNPD
jgi:hypothetical protein